MLQCLSNSEVKNNSHVIFALNYLGVQLNPHCHDLGYKYILLIPDANWVKKLGDEHVNKKGQLVYVDGKPLFSCAQRYWRSELSSVGMDVLHVLDALYKHSNGKAVSESWQIETLTAIFDVSMFLLELDIGYAHKNLRFLEKCRKNSVDNLTRLGKQQGIDF
ncbi:hypothetical protein L195_g021135 [Trifolium pratense]|uniref:Uncharacterized protein n=2 Tax=Trifolium pratense TaxID=57577 RepID=A0A2K3N4D8_TRIPR|nr:hypothetical protein L195_g021135 [Trifolium pratense]